MLDLAVARCQARNAVLGLHGGGRAVRLSAPAQRASPIEEARAVATACWSLAARVAVAVLALAQVANLFGYYKLTQFLTVLCIYSTFIALAIFTGVRVFTLLLLAALEAACGRAAGAGAPASRGHRALGTARAAVGRHPGVAGRHPGSDGRARLGQRADSSPCWISISPAAPATSRWAACSVFWPILLLGFALSSALRFLLREELLKRLHLKRGIPELISTTLHYLLLLLVFLFAVNAGGVALNKFTVLTGALGVGVGFGLQNIINNFVSGLILQFERPIRIGDVRGNRAALTGHGDSHRHTLQHRPDLPGRRGHHSQCQLHLRQCDQLDALRVQAPAGIAGRRGLWQRSQAGEESCWSRPAIQHPDVLTSPAPAVFFMGFGDSSLNFELSSG